MSLKMTGSEPENSDRRGNEAVQEKKGCWHCILSFIGGLWATRHITNTAAQEVYVRTTIRELAVYVIFLVVLCILTFGMTNTMLYYYTKVMTDLFVEMPFGSFDTTVRTATQVKDFWQFAESTMMDGLYWEHWYERERAIRNTSQEDRNILYENRLLGLPRLRQLRVGNDSCEVHIDFQHTIQSCYSGYSKDFEYQEPFGLMNGTAWTYHTEEELSGLSHWGKLATYGGGGFFVDLGTSRASTQQTIANLKQNLWIQRGTRAVFLDFTVYNANINLFCVIKLVFEFPATGGMFPSWSFRTVKLLRYVTAFDYFIMGCEFFFCVFTAYYIIEEFIELRKNKLSHFMDFWNIIDIVLILVSSLCIAFSAFRYILVGNVLKTLLSDPNRYANFEFLGFWQTQFNNMVALCIFFSWIKLFKYVSFNKTMTQLSSTLSRSAKDVAGFALMFFIVFFAFAQLGHLLFGTQVKDFSTFGDAVFTLLRVILGDFDYEVIEEANRVLGPVFFLSYVFFVFFVLLNMFLAIINDTYSQVKAEITEQKDELVIAEYFKWGYKNMLCKLGKRDKLHSIKRALKVASNDETVTLIEIRKSLKRCGLSNLEIEIFLARYDLDEQLRFSGAEVHRMVADLEELKLILEKELRSKEAKKESSCTELPSSDCDSVAMVPAVPEPQRQEDDLIENDPVNAGSVGHQQMEQLAKDELNKWDARHNSYVGDAQSSSKGKQKTEEITEEASK